MSNVASVTTPRTERAVGTQGGSNSGSRGKGRHGLTRARRSRRWAIYLPLGLYLLFTLVPFYWMLLFAFRKTGSTALFPWPATLEHFATVWNGAGFAIFFKNSVIIAVLTLVLTTLFALLGGYAIARFRFRGKAAFLVMMLCTQFVPGAMMLIPLFDVFRATGLINSLWRKNCTITATGFRSGTLVAETRRKEERDDAAHQPHPECGLARPGRHPRR